jgi:hypothetical protein
MQEKKHMHRLIQFVALAGVIGAVGCGATQRVNTTPPASPGDVTQTAPAGPTEVNTNRVGELPAGQEFDVRLSTTLSSETAMPEQRFEATTAVDITQNGTVLIPAGSIVRGVVTDVKRPGRIDRVGSLTLSFDQVAVRGRNYPIRGMAAQIYESGGIREEAGTAGVGAGAGAVIGGLLGGLKGAVLGAVIGAGGAIAATEGKDVQLPAGSIIRIRLDSPVMIR